MKSQEDSPRLAEQAAEARGARQMRWLRAGFWAIALVAGAAHVWAGRHYLRNSDALSYFDIADYLARGDWRQAVNAYWSPLYPMLLALVTAVVKPSPYWEFALAHGVSFLIFFFALGCFDYLLHELLRAHRQHRAPSPTKRHAAFSERALAALGYALFIWTALFLIRVIAESPDMLVAGLIYLAAGLLVRIRCGRSGWPSFVALGVALGVGYWAKSPMFVLAFCFLLVALFAAGGVRRAWPRALAAGVIFLALSGPYVVAISKAKGRPTFGESGRLNTMWVINDVFHLHGQGGADVRGSFTHPTRRIFERPAAYEFAEPVGGTYPAWYDPSYWYDGASGRLTLKGIAAATKWNLEALYRYFYSDVLCGLLAVSVVLGLMSKPFEFAAGLWRYAHLLAPALFGIAMFSALHAETRYLAPFIVLLWLALWAGARLPDGELARRTFRGAALALVALMVFSTFASSVSEFGKAAASLVRGEDPAEHEQWQVAEGVKQLGVQPGDRVAAVGNAQRAFWAKLSRARVVAEVPEKEAAAFWAADDAVKAKVLAALAATGAKVVVADSLPPCPVPSGWQRIRNTTFYACVLSGSRQ
jgi:hypothetical protein